MQTKTSQKSLSDIITLAAQETAIPLGPETKKQLLFYFNELQRWNRVTNLTGIKDMNALVLKHLGDTLLILKHISQGTATALDIGTGAGIPGLLMKIIRPEICMVLAEAAKKKCSFLRFISAGLELKDIFIEERRIGPGTPPDHLPGKGFDLIVSQATGHVRWFVETALTFLAPDGTMIMQKGPGGLEELEDCRPLLEQTGLSLRVIKDRLPIAGHMRLLIELKFNRIPKKPIQ